ncbi:hypothetical protein B9Z55_017371 [Caenorhabditis nigoni]|uniref:Uncharacterized protein n=1 Tax=Caenorhabditis nigoni TaxID=1611254 RepID=A0A2G5T9F4_9PELO|nr:hypothetical protein B9Z55_017371 [Caenorhabditis nigoni]
MPYNLFRQNFIGLVCSYTFRKIFVLSILGNFAPNVAGGEISIGRKCNGNCKLGTVALRKMLSDGGWIEHRLLQTTECSTK